MFSRGDTLAREVALRIAVPAADATAVRAVPPEARADGMRLVKLDDYTDWVYEAASVTVAGATCLVPVDAPAAGRWIALVATAASDSTPSAAGLASAALTGGFHAPAADRTALKAIAASARADGMFCLVLSDMSTWMFSAASAAADTSENLVCTPGAGTGRWLRYDKEVVLSLAFTFATADNATLFTVPVGARLRPSAAWWDIAVSMTGGTVSAIGLHASPSGWATKGDILGGAAGDTDATLVSTTTRMQGTVGALLNGGSSGTSRLILIAADTIKYDRITSAHTAGSGNARVLCNVIANAGA